ncbi:MAG TPA: LD-carboxypeptidase, partial [Thermoanaerobaculia bacterium]
MLIRPGALPRNGRIVVLAISSPSEMPRIKAAARALEERGLRVTLGANIDHRHRGYLAGDDDERLEELNHYLKSDDVDAFFFARGGYGAMRILDRVDYDAITANPRPIIGFSDITALHQAVAARCG